MKKEYVVKSLTEDLAEIGVVLSEDGDEEIKAAVEVTNQAIEKLHDVIDELEVARKKGDSKKLAELTKRYEEADKVCQEAFARQEKFFKANGYLSEDVASVEKLIKVLCDMAKDEASVWVKEKGGLDAKENAEAYYDDILHNLISPRKGKYIDKYKDIGEIFDAMPIEEYQKVGKALLHFIRDLKIFQPSDKDRGPWDTESEGKPLSPEAMALKRKEMKRLGNLEPAGLGYYRDDKAEHHYIWDRYNNKFVEKDPKTLPWNMPESEKRKLFPQNKKEFAALQKVLNKRKEDRKKI
jgi:hypothetical protein